MEFNKTLDDFFHGKSGTGCSESEISGLESQFNVRLPAPYREFLRRAGKGVGDLWRGSDYRLDMLSDMQEAAVELLGEENLKMPDGSFVFFMHQGYQFFLLNDDGVFFYLEGNKEMEKRHECFEEFFDATANTL